MVSDNINPIKPNDPNKDSKSIDSGASRVSKEKDTTTNDRALNVRKEFESINASRNLMRKGEDASRKYSETKSDEANLFVSADEHKNNASLLTLQAAQLRAKAKGQSLAKRMLLEQQAKRKELEAMQEMQKAEKATNDAYIKRTEADPHKFNAEEKKGDAEELNRQSNNARRNETELKSKLDDPVEKGIAKKSNDFTKKDHIAERTGGFGSLGIFRKVLDDLIKNPVIGSGILAQARALLRQVLVNQSRPFSTNPTNMLAMLRTNRTIYDQVISMLDAAQVDSALQGTISNQEIIFTRTQATAGKGEVENSIQFWQQMQEQNKQAQKDTHKGAERA